MLLNAHGAGVLQLKIIITKLVNSCSFEEYREKMFTKYGVPDYEFMVPIEE